MIFKKPIHRASPLLLAVALVSGCGEEQATSKTITVSANAQAPIEVKVSDPKPGGDATIWKIHDVTVENVSDRPIVISDFQGGAYLGGNALLVGTRCGPGNPNDSEKPPSVICTADARVPRTIEPQGSASLDGVSIWKNLKGMDALKNGDYQWKRDLEWRYVESEMMQKTPVTFTYSIAGAP